MTPQEQIKKILVVDDDIELAKTIATHLKWEGYHVIHAMDGFQAQLMIATSKKEGNPIEVVITDYLMPHTDGLELVEWIQEKYGEISIIVMSGVLNEETIRETLRPEKDFYKVKPITPFDIEKLLLRIALKCEKSATESPGKRAGNTYFIGD